MSYSYIKSKNYFRNQDDVVSDPELIATKYLIGKNAYFEVTLALAEKEALDSSRGSTSVSQEAAVSFVYGGGGGGGGGGFGCPEKEEPVWVESKSGNPMAITAKDLLKSSQNWKLYNPLTRNFNALSKAQLIKNVDLYLPETLHGALSRVSGTHKYVRNTGDLLGTFLPVNKLRDYGECLSVDTNKFNLQLDEILVISKAGKGDVVEITLENEFMYMIGHSLKYVQVAHNLKPLD